MSAWTGNIYIIIICIILGMLPDIIGWAEKIIYNNPYAWEWYGKIHRDWWWLWWIPPIGLHVLLDRFTHGIGKRWWVLKERLWMEVLVWIVMLFWLMLIV
jgi:hypothetical protein